MKQYNVTGMSCAACSARVEKAVGKVPGVTACSVSLLTNSMGVEGTAATMAEGYGASEKGAAQSSPSADEQQLEDHETPRIRRRLLWSVGFLLVLMYFSMGHMMWGWPLPHFYDDNHVAMGLTQLLLTGIIMVINQKFFISGFKGLIHRAPNMDTLVALIAGFIIVPAVFATLGSENVGKGGGFAFASLAGVFEHMAGGAFFGVLFYMLLLFAALTSSIALTESAVSTLQDELHWSRKKATSIMGVSMVLLGSLSSLGYGPLANVTVIGMQFLDFFDFLTNSVMMPVAAIATCLLVSRVIGVEKIAEEVTQDGQRFRRKPVFDFMIRYLCPVFAAIILASSVANALGWISM